MAREAGALTGATMGTRGTAHLGRAGLTPEIQVLLWDSLRC